MSIWLKAENWPNMDLHIEFELSYLQHLPTATKLRFGVCVYGGPLADRGATEDKRNSLIKELRSPDITKSKTSGH